MLGLGRFYFFSLLLDVVTNIKATEIKVRAWYHIVMMSCSAFSYYSCSWGSHGKTTGGVFHSLLQWTTFCQNSPLWPVCLGCPCMAWLIAPLSYTSLFAMTMILRQCIKKKKRQFVDRGSHSQSYGFPGSLGVIVFHKEGWGLKNWCCELWCWRRLLRVSWAARRSNQSILKAINPDYSLEGLTLKLKLQCFGHLMQRSDSLERTLMLGKTEGKRRRGWQRMRWWNSIINSVDMNLSKLREIVKDRKVWGVAVHGAAENRTRLCDWTTTACSAVIEMLSLYRDMYDIWRVCDFLFKKSLQFCKMIQGWKNCNTEKYKKCKNLLIP